MSILLQEAAAISLRQKEERQAAVKSLAYRQVYAGDVEPEQIVATCEAAGVSLDDYGAEVTRLEKRKAALATIAGQAELETKQAELLATIDGAEKELIAAQERYSAIVLPARQEQQDVGVQVSLAHEARKSLRNGCKDSAIIGRLNAIAAELHPSAARVRHLKGRQAELRLIIKGHEDQLSTFQVMTVPVNSGGQSWRGGAITRGGGGMDLAAAQKMNAALETCKAERDRNEAELARLEPRVAALTTEQEELLARAEQSPV